MASISRAEITKTTPIGAGLDGFREKYNSVEIGKLNDKALQDIISDLLDTILVLPATRELRSASRYNYLKTDLANFYTRLDGNGTFDGARSAIPVLRKVICKAPDEEIWNAVYELVAESTPPPRPPASVDQTPNRFTTSGIINSSEHRKDMDDTLKEELSPVYVGVPGFYEAFFCTNTALQTTFEKVFVGCQAGEKALYQEKSGWRDWPGGSKEGDVLSWISAHIKHFLRLANTQPSVPQVSRGPVARPMQPLAGSKADRKLDIGFVDESTARDGSHRWEQILIPGELKSNPAADNHSKTWFDLGRYAREVLTAQSTRRFVLGFTLCGSLMRLWLFDRLGAIASASFDIHREGLRFVSVMLTFLWMSREQLGFDPSIMDLNNQQVMEIRRGEQIERFIIDGLLKRSACIAGRATTCWRAHREDDTSKTVFVIKDSWQYTKREEEGDLLREATEKSVTNVARHHWHGKVFVGGHVDNVCVNIRKGLDITQASNYVFESRKVEARQRSSRTAGSRDESNRGRSFENCNGVSRKRSSSSFHARLPSSKRSCSSSPMKQLNPFEPNREHRRVIVRDYGKPLYKASSPAALLFALKGCIEGYEGLYKQTGLLQRDISIGNLLMNEDEANDSWPAFIIDLDLAIRAGRTDSSMSQNKTGTRPFMAIGILYNEQHSYRHDLESFFWVLFWICVHYDGPGKDVGSTKFERWNFEDTDDLALLKVGIISSEESFLRVAKKHFTSYYAPLIPWANRLRRVVFPGGSSRKDDSEDQFSLMKAIFSEGQQDPEVVKVLSIKL